MQTSIESANAKVFCCEVDVGKDELVSVEIMKGKNRLNTKSALCKPRDPGWGLNDFGGHFRSDRENSHFNRSLLGEQFTGESV